MNLTQDFKDLLDALSRYEVDFIIVGAYAVMTYVGIRNTGDLDVWVRPTPENASRVYAALAEFGAPLAIQKVTQDYFAEPGNVYQIGVEPNRIDVLTSLTGLHFDQAWQTKKQSNWEHLTFHVLGADELIVNKSQLGRDQDKLDVDRLKKYKSKQ